MKRILKVFLFFSILLVVFVLTLKAMDKQRNAPVVKEQNALIEQQQYEQKILIEARWGNGQDEFGLEIKQGTDPLGPLTFALDPEGNIYIVDAVNRQMKKFNKEGHYKNAMASKGYWEAVYIDTNQNFYVRKGRTIEHYSKDGALVESFEISKDIDLLEGYGQGVLLDKEGNLCVNRLQTIYTVAKPIDGGIKSTQRISQFKLLSHSEQVQNQRFGLPGNKIGSYFVVKWLDNHDAVVKALGADGAVLKEILMKTDDAFGSILFLGQDAQGALYIETERITADNHIHKEVRKYNPNGDMLAIIELPNDYFTTVNKKIAVDSQGAIYQLQTTPTGVKLTKWEQRSK